ncbi:hypothetical protein [Corynebacterium uropygiale]|uniref:hypothetical protein n=1 Tax=Corynebacterium uropygiale TaxID=1775911 RepID=UPI0030846EBC
MPWRHHQPIHWPTVAVSAGASAIVAALILTLGVLAFQREPRPSAVAADAQTVTVSPSPGAPASPATSVSGSETASTSAASSSTTPAAPTPTALPEGQLGAATGAPAATGASSATPSPSAEPAPAPAPNPSLGWEPPAPLAADFRVTTPEPSLDDLNGIVHFLVATPASDGAKAANLEAGPAAVVVPQTVYRLGLFRAPLGWKRISGPLERNGDTLTATLDSGSAGRPSIHLRIHFVYRNGVWQLANSSVCEGVRTVGLPIHCNG